MKRTFTYTLLITCLLLVISCKTSFEYQSSKAENISVSGNFNTINNQVVQLYTPYKNILEKDMNRVISVSEKEMEKDKPESYLTNFLADLLLEEGKNTATALNLNFAPDISYFNYGGIRSFLPEGEINVGKIFELMPFENQLVFIELKGNQVQEFLNLLAEKGGDSVGGVRFKISNEKATKIEIAGLPLDSNKKYWVATNDYVANGGDNFQVFTERSKYINSEKLIRNVIISHLEEIHKKGNKISVELDGRISYE